MKLKSLLIGSAAVMAVSTGGAKAADAIVMAEPEPMEYVRICDVYGAGFFYIPGTETCLRISGYMRLDVGLNFSGGGFGTQARFAPKFDARTETEWGTLRGYGELEFNYDNNWTVIGAGSNFTVAHAYIELITASGTLRLGKSHRPYARFLGYGAPLVLDAPTGFAHANEISYTFAGSNGFSAIVALIDDDVFDWAPDVEGGIKLDQGWGMAGISAGYDSSAGTWGVKGALTAKAANGSFSAGLLVFYSSGVGSYAIVNPTSAAVAPWNVTGWVRGQFTPTVAGIFKASWYSDNGALEFVGGLDVTPFSAKAADGNPSFRIRPEVRYRTIANTWYGIVRFDRNF